MSCQYEDLGLPYISCSSIGSTLSSSPLDSSESEEGGKNGSGRYADEGTVVAKRLLGVFDD